MSIEQLEKSLLQLSREERRRFAHWFYQHEHEIVESQSEDEEIQPDVKTEILRRRDEALAHPELMEPWDRTMKEARQMLYEIRRKKAQSR